MKKLKLGAFGAVLVVFILSILVVTLPHSASAAPAFTCTWTAGTGGGNGNFSAAANWSGCNGAAPQPGDDDNLVFNTNTPLYNNPNNDITGLTVNNIHFVGSSSTFWYSLIGNPITINGGVTDDSTSSVTGITNTLIVSGNQTFSSATNTNYSSLQGSANVTLSGNGAATFADLSSYTGTLSSTNSNIRLESYNTFTSSASVVVSSTAALTLVNESARDANTTFNLPVSLGGDGVGKIGALNLVGQGNGDSITLPASVILTSDVQVTADGNTTLNIDGSINYNHHTISSVGQNVTTITVAPGNNQSSQTPGIGSNVTYIVDGQTGSTTVANGGLLKGNGTVASGIIQAGGSIAPGHSPGCLTFTGSLTMNGTYTAQIQGPGNTACTDYDQLIVGSFIDLTGSTLDLQFINSFNPAVGQTYEIINNERNSSISGNFIGLPESMVFAVGNTKLQISYKGGGDNSVVLTVVDPSTPLGVPAPPDTGFGVFQADVRRTLEEYSLVSGGLFIGFVISRKFAHR